MTDKEKNTLIMLALFQSTVEQSTHLTGEYKMKMKHDFNVWQKQGFQLLQHFEREIPNFNELITPISDAIHASFSEIKDITN